MRGWNERCPGVGKRGAAHPRRGSIGPTGGSFCAGGCAAGRPRLVNPQDTAARPASRGACPGRCAKPGWEIRGGLRDVAQGMSLVPAVTELLLAEFMYLQYDDVQRPIHLYINSTGVAVRNAAPIRLARIWGRLLHYPYSSCSLPSLHLIGQCLQAEGLTCCTRGGPVERGGQAGLRGGGFRDLRHHAVR